MPRGNIRVVDGLDTIVAVNVGYSTHLNPLKYVGERVVVLRQSPKPGGVTVAVDELVVSVGRQNRVLHIVHCRVSWFHQIYDSDVVR